MRHAHALVGAVLGVVASAAAVPLFSGFGASAQPSVYATPRNIIVNEPVVLYDRTGGTLAGPIHENLVVYSSGLVTYAFASEVVIPPGGESVVARVAYIPPERLTALREELAASGAGTLTDARFEVSDVPLNSATYFFTPGPSSRTNSFNYWLGFEEHAAFDQAVRNLIHELFGS